VHFSKKQLDICAHHFKTITSNHLSSGILVVHISAVHNNIKDRIKGVPKKLKNALDLGYFQVYQKLP